jgi:hypothetical protein
MSTYTDAAKDRAPRADSLIAKRLFDDLMDAPPDLRTTYIKTLNGPDLRQVFAIAEANGGTPYCLWVDNPVGFVEDVLGESVWSIPQAMFTGLTTHKRVAVPSSFSTGKTWSASRLSLWWSVVHPVGTGLVVILAPLWRQVERQVFPEIRRAHRMNGLPGWVDMTQMKIPSASGVDTVVAYGIAAAPHNEAAVQGIHIPNLLIIVDEAGGISHQIGRNLRGLLTGPNSRLLAIGNPPTDNEGSWFEQLAEHTEGVLTLPIPALSTPAFTGEAVGLCGSCGPEVPAHPITKHLVDPDWVEEVKADYGEDSAYFQAKVLAKFPKGTGDRVLPVSWIEAAQQSDEPVDDDGEPLDGYVRLSALGLPDEPSDLCVRRGAWVRLGVDVAADGGDEFTIARLVGDLSTIEHTSSGETNANAVDVAGKVKVEIDRANLLRKALGTTAKVRVKIDGIGLGWGVGSLLVKWAEEGIIDAEIVVVVVSEGTDRDDEDAPMRPANKRAEMWLALRSLLQPRADGNSPLRLRVDKRTAAQLAGPSKSTTATGRIAIEKKDAMKKRGLTSPDRAEALLLSAYEPAPPKPKRKKVHVIGA